MVPKAFSKVIKRERQVGVAFALGVAQSAVSRWVNGAIPDAEVLVRIQRIYGVPVEAWFRESSK